MQLKFLIFNFLNYKRFLNGLYLSYNASFSSSFEAALAEKITFAGIEQVVILKRSDQLTRMLEHRVITEGDILSFTAMGRRIDFIILDHSPKTDAVRIHLDTKIIISEKPIKTEIRNYKNIICSKCGYHIRFCPGCGNDLKN